MLQFSQPCERPEAAFQAPPVEGFDPEQSAPW